MARVKQPDPMRLHDFEQENKIPWGHIRWETKRSYIRIDGAFKAIGWLIQYGPMELSAKRKWYFLPD